MWAAALSGHERKEDRNPHAASHHSPAPVLSHPRTRAATTCRGTSHIPVNDAGPFTTQRRCIHLMRNPKRLMLLGASSLGILALLVSVFFVRFGASHASAGQGTIQQVTSLGHGSLAVSGASATDATGPLNYEYKVEQEVDTAIPHTGNGAIRVPADHVPQPASNALATSNSGFSGFNGLSHRDQRLAGTGSYLNTQFSLVPPDQALCVGSGFVVESINTALRVFNTSGAPQTSAIALNQFFGFIPEINRTNGVRGDFTSDPKCYYDSANGGHFFLTILREDTVGRTHLDFAVTATNDPTGSWNLFDIDSTDDGHNGTPSNPNCPCLGDQPLIGADANGFYITTNEFPFSGGFNGAQVYAMDKNALEGGSLPAVVHINAGARPTPDAGGIWYSIQPATVPEGGSYATDTEYFLSALQFGPAPLDNRIAVWALTGTNTLSSATPAVTLSDAVIASEVYGQPPASDQKSGTLILPGLEAALGVAPVNEKLEFLASNDDRMNQVVYAGGYLWSGVNTVIASNGSTRVGIAYFIVSPAVSGGQVAGAMANQGYVSLQHDDVLFPSIGVNTAGRGVMTFSIAGPDFFPSSGYAAIDAPHGAGAVHVAGAGANSDDSFGGYVAFGGTDRVDRWGDYSAAVAAADGSIWLASEYIPNAPRTVLANWGTFISNVQP